MSVCLRDKLLRRGGHIAVAYNDVMIIWGGIVEHLPKGAKHPNTIPSNSNDFHNPDEIFSFDPCSFEWTKIRTKGHVPPPTVGASGTIFGDFLYVFGGYCITEEDEGYNNELYRLNLRDRSWVKLASLLLSNETRSSIQIEKAGLVEHNGRLVVFGGYGDKPEQYSENFILDPESTDTWPTGWNNYVFNYDIAKDSWEESKTRGKRPKARAGHGVARIANKMYVFGGRTVDKRLNDLHCLDLDTMTWSEIWEGCQPGELQNWLQNSNFDGILDTEDGTIVPEPRALHSFTSIPGKEDEFFVYGGIGLFNAPLNDAWILKVTESEYSWKYGFLNYDHGEIRCWHGACAFENWSEILIHSGLTQEFYINRLDLDNHPESVLTFKFGVGSLFRLSFEKVIDNLDCFSKSQIEGLPKNLYKMIKIRITGDDLYPSNANPPTDPPYSRSILHSGV